MKTKVKSQKSKMRDEAFGARLWAIRTSFVQFVQFVAKKICPSCASCASRLKKDHEIKQIPDTQG